MQLKIINADNGYIVNGADFVTVTGVETDFTKQRWATGAKLGTVASCSTHRNATFCRAVCRGRTTGVGSVSAQPPKPALCHSPYLHCTALLVLSVRSAGPAMNDRNGHHGLWIQGSSNVLMTK